MLLLAVLSCYIHYTLCVVFNVLRCSAVSSYTSESVITVTSDKEVFGSHPLHWFQEFFKDSSTLQDRAFFAEFDSYLWKKMIMFS